MSGGHAVLRWSDIRVNEHVRTVKEVPGRLPFLDDGAGVDPAGMLGERGVATEREAR